MGILSKQSGTRTRRPEWKDEKRGYNRTVENTSITGIHEDKEGCSGKGLRLQVEGRCEELYGILLLV